MPDKVLHCRVPASEHRFDEADERSSDCRALQPSKRPDPRMRFQRPLPNQRQKCYSPRHPAGRPLRGHAPKFIVHTLSDWINILYLGGEVGEGVARDNACGASGHVVLGDRAPESQESPRKPEQGEHLSPELSCPLAHGRYGRASPRPLARDVGHDPSGTGSLSTDVAYGPTRA